MNDRHHGPLSGIRVLELGHIVAGPAASLILADLGAEVIKIERPGGGDQARVNTGNQGHFLVYNSNKRSAALDLGSETGREAFRRLLKRSDVLLDNFAPKALDRLGFGPETLAEINPRLIHCAIKGFLPGPYQDRPLTDEPAQMMGGLAYMTGPAGRPLRAGTSAVDLTGALFAVIAVITALLERTGTGRGRAIRVGLFESVVYLVGQHVAKAGLTREAPVPMPERGMGRELGWGIYRIFETGDARQVFVGVLSDGHWEKFCKEFALDDLWAEDALRTNTGRTLAHDRLTRRTEALIASMTFDEAIRRLERAAIPFAPVNTPLDILDHPHLKQGGYLKPVLAADGRSSVVPDIPIATPGWLVSARATPPALGQDTLDILKELGLSEESDETTGSDRR